MYLLSSFILTVAAWGVGLMLDGNTSTNPPGFLCLRVLLPVLVMGLCILHALKSKDSKAENKDNEK